MRALPTSTGECSAERAFVCVFADGLATSSEDEKQYDILWNDHGHAFSHSISLKDGDFTE